MTQVAKSSLGKGKEMNTINVVANWDSEAEVWVATSEDVPGLILESDTAEGIIEEAKQVIPELLRHNSHAEVHGSYSCRVTTEAMFEVGT